MVADHYRALWQELNARRREAQLRDPAAPAQPGVTPYGTLFGHYPSQQQPAQLPPQLQLVAAADATPPHWLGQAMQSTFLARLLGSDLQPLIAHLQAEGSLTPAALSGLGVPAERQAVVVQALRKLGVVA